MNGVVRDLDYRGRGVLRESGRVVFVAGALPGETVAYRITNAKKRFAEGVVTEVLQPSPERVTPPCPHYARCGGCDLQHLALAAQRRWKENWWTGQLARHGGGVPETLWPLLADDGWHYRRRARLAVANGKMGFRARAAHEVVTTDQCLVLDERLNALLPALARLLPQLPPVSEITLNAGDANLAVAFASRAAPAQDILQDFAQMSGAAVWWGKEQIAGGTLAYQLPEFAVDIRYTPADFTQANAQLNRAMVAQAMRFLQPQPGERIADFFSGLGNFSLPMARLGAEVVALEGEQAMVKRAQALADAQQLPLHAARADLFTVTEKTLKNLGRFDAWLLDPPRAGAQALVSAIGKHSAPERILYVSCDAATLVRDAAILRGKGYQLAGGGIIDMFAQTAHLESMALFVQEK
ncbi:MAG: 23S rRNA methyltransferase [Cardiobacteriaceae bacterium]|nr:23S rRNA methyltransferase [Cardiobacteriaceae bacterium]